MLLHIQLNATGHVEAAGVVQVSGFALLDEAALKAVRAWEFEAAHRLGSGSAGAVVEDCLLQVSDSHERMAKPLLINDAKDILWDIILDEALKAF